MTATVPQRPGSALARRLRQQLKKVAYLGGLRGRWQRPGEVVAALGLVEGDRVADLGAGAGYFTLPLARAVGPAGRVYAVDTDSDLHEVVRRRAARAGLGNVVPVAGGDEDPRLPEPVDLVLIVDAYHHLPDPPRYIAGLAAHVRAGARVAVIEPPLRGPHRLIGHATRPEELRAAFARAGYTLVQEEFFLPRQTFQVFRRPVTPRPG